MEQKEKTIREWFETFPEPYRTQAIENTRERSLNTKAPSAIEALSLGFVWSSSQQGLGYWLKFESTLK